jgi:hypothetical protein
MKQMKNFWLPLLITVLFSGCAKKDEVNCIAGSNGNLQVKVVPQMDGGDVYSSEANPVMVMIGYDIVDSKGDNPDNYDRIVKAKNNENWISCNKMSCGIYYFRVLRTESSTGKKYSGGMSLITEQDTGQIELKIEISAN